MPETFHIHPFPTVDNERFVAPRRFSTFVRRIVRAGFEQDKMSCDTVKNKSALSFVCLFRFFHNISKTVRPILTNINVGGGGGG
jgi:hypothetical protein